MDNINHLVKQYILWPELKNDFQKNIDLSKVTMAQFSEEIEPILNQRKPIETEMALFYLLNEKLSKTRKNNQDVLGPEQLKEFSCYQDTMNRLSKSLLSYIVTACMVEGRHSKLFSYLTFDWRKSFNTYSLDDDMSNLSFNECYNFIISRPSGKEFLKNHAQKYLPFYKDEQKFFDFLSFSFKIKSEIQPLLDSVSRSGGYSIVAKDHLNLGDKTIDEVLSDLISLFKINQFSGGFGGKPWEDIASHGLKFVRGEINAEMFIDQAFSLEHNNGNMFNKDFLFTQKSSFKFFYYNEIRNKKPMLLNVSIPPTSLILNAQHLGTLSGLLSINQTLKKILNTSPDLIYEKMQENFNQSYSIEKFNFYHKAAIKFYKKIIQNISSINTDLSKKYPDFFKNIEYKPVDLKKLMNEVVLRNIGKHIHPELFDLTNNENNIGYFDYINYLHNDYFNPVNNNVLAKEFAFNFYDIENLFSNNLNSPENNINLMDKNLIGGKAWSLANMNQLGFTVPKAKVFTTECCSSYYQHKELFNQSLENSLLVFKDYLKDENNNPILCSVRSGAPVSMPGMMDTILNVGIDDSNYQYFSDTLGKNVTDKCVNKFMELFCSSRLNTKIHFNDNLSNNLLLFRTLLKKYQINFNEETIFPLTIQQQIKESLYAVFDSWYSERAKAYRVEKNISHDLGTAAIVQQMVFGNLNDNSCTGVVFSRNCLTGENQLVGEFLPKAQGEDVVSGSVTPFPIEQFKVFNPQAYEQLYQTAKKLEAQTGQIQDIEFTVEDGKLYILQHRQAVCSPVAVIKLLEDKNINQESLLKQIDPQLLKKSYIISTKDIPDCFGLSANSGVLHGMVVKSLEDIQLYKNEFSQLGRKIKNLGLIFYADLTSPEHMPIMNKTHGFITEQGGFTSHAAIIARSLNKPCIVGLGSNNTKRFSSGELITIDGDSGKIWKGIKSLVVNDKLAKSAAKILIKSKKIKLKDINEEEFNNRINYINQQHNSWFFNFPNVKEINYKPVKIDKFLNLGQKVAMIIAANQHNPLKANLTLIKKKKK